MTTDNQYIEWSDDQVLAAFWFVKARQDDFEEVTILDWKNNIETRLNIFAYKQLIETLRDNLINP